MAIGTPVNRGSAQLDTNQATLPVTTSGAIASGSKIILSVGWRTATTLSSVAGGSLTWTIDTQRVNAGATQHAALVSADAPSGLASGTTITLTFSANTSAKIVSVEEVTGLAAQGACFDVTTGSDTSSSSTSLTTGTTGTTTLADELLMAVGFLQAIPTTVTWGSSFTGLTTLSSPTRGFSNAYRIVSATGTYSGSATLSPSIVGGYTAIIGTYKMAGGTPVTVTAPVATGEVRGLERDGFWNSAEGGSNGTTVSFGIAGNTGGVSGDYFDTGNTSGGLIFDSAQKAHGSLSYQVTSSPAFLERNRIGVLSDGYMRDYCRISALPSATRNLVSANLGGSLVWAMAVDTTGHILIRDGTLTTRATSTATVSAGSWFRLEAHHNSSAELVVRLYTSMDSTAITETLTASSGTAGTIDKLRWVNSESGGHVVWHDDTVAGAAAWPGPYTLDPGLLAATMVAPCGTGTAVGITPTVSSSTEFYTDTFERTVSAGTTYGTADLGGAYTAYTTVTGTGVSVSSGAGRVNPSAVPKTYHQAVNGATGTDVKVWALISFSTLAAGGSQEMSVYCRSDTGSDNYYTADLEQLTDGSCRLSIEKNTVGTRTDIAAPLSLGSYGSADTKWWIELIVAGGNMEARAWLDGGSRPSTPTRSGSDSSFTASGNVGLRSRVNVSNTNAAEFRFWEAHAQPATITDITVSGVVGSGSAVGVTPSLLEVVTAPLGTGTTVGVAPVVKSTLVAPVATASGSGVVPTLPLLVAGVVGTGSVVGLAPTLRATEVSPVGTASGVGVVPTVRADMLAPVGTGSGVGIAPTLIAPSPGLVVAPVGTGTAVGVVPVLTARLTAPVGTGSGVGVAPTLPLLVGGVVGTGSGVGIAPALRSTLLPPVATGVAAGFAPGLVGPAVAPVATGTAIGVVPSLRATMLAPVGAATAVGITPAVIGPQVAGVGSGNAVGVVPVVSSRLTAPVGSGSAVGIAPSLRASMLPAVATATAVGFAPFLGAGTFIAPPVGLGTAVGFVPKLIGPLAGVVGTGTATGVIPTLRATLIAPLGTASGAGLVPTLTSGVAPVVAPVGTGSAVGIAPTLRALLAGVVGTGTAVGRAPLLLAGTIIVPPVGTATAVGRAPVLLVLVQAPVGTAVGTGLAPQVSALIQAPVATGGTTGLPGSLLVTILVPMGSGSAIGIKPLLILPGSIFAVFNEPWTVSATNEVYQAALRSEPSAGTVGTMSGTEQVTDQPYELVALNGPA